MTRVDELVFDPFSQAILDDPYPTFDAMLEHAPVYHNEELGFWTLCRFDDVQAAARNWATFSSAEGVDLDFMAKLMCGPGDFLDVDPPRHDQLRDVVRHRFTPKAIDLLEDRVRELAEGLVDDIVERGTADLVRDLARPIPVTIISELLGFPPEDHALLATWHGEAFERIPGDPVIPRSALEAAFNIRGYVAEAAAERRKHARDDVLTLIVTRKAGDRYLTEPEIVGMCFILYIAGMETTWSFISNSLLLLAQQPDQRALVVSRAVPMQHAIEELLRFESPVQNNARTTTRDVELHAVTIPAGARVALLFGAANRDPRCWDGPNVLDVTRPPKRNLAFGEGIHYCIGAPLARLEGRIALETFLRRAPEYEVHGPIERLPNQNLRVLASLTATV